MILAQNSSAKRLNLYDVWAVVREFLMLCASLLIVNLDAVGNFLYNIGVPETIASIILFALAEVGRRFFKDYSKK